MTWTANLGVDEELVQRVEGFLMSMKAIVAARIILDEEEGAQVHIISTHEMPASEVSRAAVSALKWGLGLDVTSEQITVVQSHFSWDELSALMDRKKSGSRATGAVPEGSPPAPSGIKPSMPDTGLLEFSIGGSDVTARYRSDLDLPRLRVQHLDVARKPGGGFNVGLRLGENGNSVDVLREGGESEADMLELPACAALDAVQEFLQKQLGDRLGFDLRFLGARRLRNPTHDVVVVLVEAVINGRRIPLTGAASAHKGVERASILATLQATNAFVAETLLPG